MRRLPQTHTPGAKLDRPDQTSRGDPVEEPRVRLVPSLFRAIEQRWGPFDSLLGPERAFARRIETQGSRQRVWLHPTYRTVGSGLRLLADRMAADGSTEAVAIVPSPPSESWGKLLRHGSVIGELPAGDGILEAHSPNGWLPIIARRPALIVSFPRAAGSFCRPIVTTELPSTEEAGALTHGYVETAAGFCLPLLPGSFVYERAAEGSDVPGKLFSVVLTYHPGDSAGGRSVVARELRRAAPGSMAARRGSAVGFDLSDRAAPQLVQASSLIDVSHLVKKLQAESRGRTTSFVVDLRRAAAESERWAAMAAQSAQSGPPARLSEGAAGDGAAKDDGPAEFDGRTAGDAAAEARAGGAAADLTFAQRRLAMLNLRAAPTMRGAEGKLPLKPARELPIASDSQPVAPRKQRNQHAGMRCSGCHELIKVGQTMVSVADGLAHDDESCRVLAQQAVDAALARGEGSSAGPPRFFVVTQGKQTGLFSDRATATAAAGGMRGVRMCATLAEARELMGKGERAPGEGAHALASLAEMSSQVSGLVPGGAAAGSIQRRAQLSEKLGDARVELVMRCINGACDVTGETPKPCLGGCGRTLHMLECARVGKGYAALGNFTCPECRCERMVKSGEPTPQLLRRAANTMLLEMTQGAEATAGGYADYVRLAEEYSTGSGMAQAGGALFLPHERLESCKDFLSWLVLDDERALSLESTLLGAEAYVTKVSPTGAQNFFKHPAVKAHQKTLKGSSGVTSEPSTTATPLMLSVAWIVTTMKQFVFHETG